MLEVWMSNEKLELQLYDGVYDAVYITQMNKA